MFENRLTALKADLRKLHPPVTPQAFKSMWFYTLFVQLVAVTATFVASPIPPVDFVSSLAGWVFFNWLIFLILKQAIYKKRQWARWLAVLIFVVQIVGSIAGLGLTSQLGILTVVATIVQIPLLSLLTYWLLERAPALWPQDQLADMNSDPTDGVSQPLGGLSDTPSNKEGAQHSSGAIPLRVKQIVGAVILVGVVYGLVQLASKFWTDKDLTIEVVQTWPDGTPIYNARRQFGVVRITNVANSPIVISEIRINGSQNETCSQKKAINLGPGEATNFPGGMFGECGNILRIAVSTDKGDDDYTINWR